MRTARRCQRGRRRAIGPKTNSGYVRDRDGWLATTHSALHLLQAVHRAIEYGTHRYGPTTGRNAFHAMSRIVHRAGDKKIIGLTTEQQLIATGRKRKLPVLGERQHHLLAFRHRRYL